jgi:hypothetical protein
VVIDGLRDDGRTERKNEEKRENEKDKHGCMIRQLQG